MNNLEEAIVTLYQFTPNQWAVARLNILARKCDGFTPEQKLALTQCIAAITVLDNRVDNFYGCAKTKE